MWHALEQVTPHKVQMNVGAGGIAGLSSKSTNRVELQDMWWDQDDDA
jgi:hypothetical protein